MKHKNLITQDTITIELNDEQRKRIQYILKKYEPLLAKPKEEEFCFEKKIETIIQDKEGIVSLLKKVLKEFKVFEEEQVIVLLTGSYARGTNRFDSDLDLHFIYKNRLKKKLAIEEELYIYIISKLTNIKRSRIHAVITTKLNKKNMEKIKKQSSNLSLKIILKNKEWVDSYEFEATTKKRFYLNYLNSKNINSFHKYLKKEIKSQNREWAHNFLAIKDESNWNKEYKKLLNYEKKKINKEKIKKQIKDLLNNLEQETEINIKRKYQTNTYYNIYNTLEIVRNYLILKGEDIPNFNLLDFLNNNKFLQVVSLKEFEEIYYYLNLIEDLAYLLKERKEIFSIHYNNDLQNYITKELEEEYKKIKELLKEILNRMRCKLNE